MNEISSQLSSATPAVKAFPVRTFHGPLLFGAGHSPACYPLPIYCVAAQKQ